ncbi:MAG: tetratricopeptide repeat protein [Myxococcales bacterium]|nr:MAG: tetratricopeptide repeat protein [Myxococcales bacterium]
MSKFATRAKRFFSERQYPAVVRTCREGLLENSRDDELRLLLGMALIYLSRFHEAQTEMKTLIEHGTRDHIVFRVLGESQINLGQISEGLRSLKLALNLKPDDSITEDLLDHGRENYPDIWHKVDAESLTIEDRLIDIQASERTQVDQAPQSAAAAMASPPIVRETRPYASSKNTQQFYDDEDAQTLAREAPSAELPMAKISSDEVTTAKNPDEMLTIDKQLSSSAISPPPRAKGSLENPHWLEDAKVSYLVRSKDFFIRLKSKLSFLAEWKKRVKAPWNRTMVFTFSAITTLLLLASVGAFFAFQSYVQRHSFGQAMQIVQRASDNGDKPTIEDALSALNALNSGRNEVLAIKARLFATLQLEHGEDQRHQIQEMLASLGSRGKALADARVALSYLYLSKGEVIAARSIVANASAHAELEQAAEVARARSLTAQAAGDTTRAELDARAAALKRKTSPRHGALAAWLTALNGDSSEALAKLSEIPDARRSPEVRVTRAKIIMRFGSNPQAASSEADEVLQALSSIASPMQKAWAHLIKAKLALDQGQTRVALRHATQAARRGPQWQDEFGLSLGEVLVRVGAVERANEVLKHLPNLATMPERRAQLRVEVALSLDDLERAQGALLAAGQGMRAKVLRAKLYELQHAYPEAISLYEQAINDKNEGSWALLQLAALEMKRGRASRAIKLLHDGLSKQPGQLQMLMMLVQAQIETGSLRAAEKSLSEGMSFFPASPQLLSLKALVALRNGKIHEALANAKAAVERDPNDISLQMQYGKMALAMAKLPEARAAFSKALEISVHHNEAWLGLARVEATSGNFDAALNILHKIKDKAADDPSFLDAEATVLVLIGAGHSGAETLSSYQTKNAHVWTSLAFLWLQSEQYAQANSAFTQAIRMDPNQANAWVGYAMLSVVEGKLAQARRFSARAEQLLRNKSDASALARVLAVRARLAFELGDFRSAQQLSNKAIEYDPNCSWAHLALALVATERHSDSKASLESAAMATVPLAEVFSMLAREENSRMRRCDLARRYLSTAPTGADAAQMQTLAKSCS